MAINRYLKLTSLQENENGFKGFTAENRHFECLCSDDNVIFLVSSKEILRVLLDKELTNWVDYKEIATQRGLALDDSGVTIQLQEKPKATPKTVKTPKAATPKVEAKTTKTTQAKTSQTKAKASTKKAASATKK